MPDRITLSAVVIALNESRQLADCLETLRWVDEIIVVDGGSTDDTVAIAKRFTNRVCVRPFDDFAAQKNFGVAEAQGEWILSIDADERVTPALAQEIQRLLHTSPRRDGYFLHRKNHLFGAFRHYAEPDWTLRLFRKDRGRFVSPIHETVQVSGPLGRPSLPLPSLPLRAGRTSFGRLRAPFHHLSTQTHHQHVQKMNLYSTFEVEKARPAEKRMTTLAFLWQFILKPWLRLGQAYVFKWGWRDGIVGWMLSMHAMWMDVMIAAKQWEHETARRD